MNLLRQIQAILTTDLQNYQDRKSASQKIDSLLGLESDTIENELIAQRKIQAPESALHPSANSHAKDFKTWIGFDHQDFQTTYHEFREILEIVKLGKGSTVVDFGCAYGRLGIVIKSLFPDLVFIGYEILPERVAEAARINAMISDGQAEIKNANLVHPNFDPPKAELYFIYDFSDKEDLKILLEKLRQKAQVLNSPLTLVARGRGINHWIFELAPWLSLVNEPRKYATWTLYSS